MVFIIVDEMQLISWQYHSTWSSCCTAMMPTMMSPSSFYACHGWYQVFSYECQSVLFPSISETNA